MKNLGLIAVFIAFACLAFWGGQFYSSKNKAPAITTATEKIATQDTKKETIVFSAPTKGKNVKKENVANVENKAFGYIKPIKIN